jgi:hypothetical protein
MVQTTQTRLERDYQIQNEPDIGLFVDSDVVLDEKMPSVSVDLDFSAGTEQRHCQPLVAVRRNLPR